MSRQIYTDNSTITQRSGTGGMRITVMTVVSLVLVAVVALIILRVTGIF